MWKERLRALLGKKDLSGRDIVVFLMSLLLAAGIWFIHNLSQDYSGTMAVAVVAESNIDGHSNVSANSSTISARCRTSGFKLFRNRHQNRREAVRILFDPKDLHLREGEIFYITAAELGNYVSQLYGDDVRLESFLSNTVQFRFPYENCKKVPVQAMSLVSFKPQYTAMGEIRLQPDSVTVYGEPFRLEKVDRVVTRTLELYKLHSSAHGIVKIEPVAGVRMSDTEVNYSLDVTRYVELETEQMVTMRNAPAGKKISIFPSMAKITYRCAFPLTSNLTDGINFYIDYKDFEGSRGGKCVPRNTGIPEGVIDYRIVPEVFECVEEGKQ